MATDQRPNSAGGRDEPDEPTDERTLPDAAGRAKLLAQSVAAEMRDRHEGVFLKTVQKLLDSDSTGTVILRTEGTVIEVEIR